MFGLLGSLLENVFYRVLIGIGLSFTTYTSLDQLLEILKNEVISQYMQLDSHILQLLGMMKIDEAMTVIFSAFVVKMTLKGFLNGSMMIAQFNGGK